MKGPEFFGLGVAIFAAISYVIIFLRGGRMNVHFRGMKMNITKSMPSNESESFHNDFKNIFNKEYCLTQFIIFNQQNLKNIFYQEYISRVKNIVHEYKLIHYGPPGNRVKKTMPDEIIEELISYMNEWGTTEFNSFFNEISKLTKSNN
jgi:hypothetical protein